MQYQLSIEQAMPARKIISATAPARDVLVEIRYVENRKHNQTFKHNKTFTYGAN